jgi:hypothetical protein
MRVYLSATVRLLDAWLRAGEVATATPGEVATATPGHVATAAGGQELEELEYEASLAAAAESAALVAADPAGPRRRVVLAADVPDGAVQADPARGPSAVRVHAVIPWSQVACALIDDADVDVSAPAADALAERPLSWYATQELTDLVTGLVGHAERSR